MNTAKAGTPKQIGQDAQGASGEVKPGGGLGGSRRSRNDRLLIRGGFCAVLSARSNPIERQLVEGKSNDDNRIQDMDRWIYKRHGGV